VRFAWLDSHGSRGLEALDRQRKVLDLEDLVNGGLFRFCACDENFFSLGVLSLLHAYARTNWVTSVPPSSIESSPRDSRIFLSITGPIASDPNGVGKILRRIHAP
jgi:hypothetical protein